MYYCFFAGPATGCSTFFEFDPIPLSALSLSFGLTLSFDLSLSNKLVLESDFVVGPVTILFIAARGRPLRKYD
jgi:hypothetical protein